MFSCNLCYHSNVNNLYLTVPPLRVQHQGASSFPQLSEQVVHALHLPVTEQTRQGTHHSSFSPAINLGVLEATTDEDLVLLLFI